MVNLGDLSASTAVESGDALALEGPESAIDMDGDSHEFGPLRVCSGPFARWEGFEPPAA